MSIYIDNIYRYMNIFHYYIDLIIYDIFYEFI